MEAAAGLKVESVKLVERVENVKEVVLEKTVEKQDGVSETVQVKEKAGQVTAV